MEKFVRVGKTVINLQRLMMLQHKPEIERDSFSQTEHYQAVFDNGSEIWLSASEGGELAALFSSSVPDKQAV